MAHLIVADSLVHADAVAKWLDIEPEADWNLTTYGSRPTGVFDKCIVVRPIGGLYQVHVDWLLEHLVPCVSGELEPYPDTWSPVVEDPVDDTA
jgi:hypothetical protein